MNNESIVTQRGSLAITEHLSLVVTCDWMRNLNKTFHNSVSIETWAQGSLHRKTLWLHFSIVTQQWRLFNKNYSVIQWLAMLVISPLILNCLVNRGLAAVELMDPLICWPPSLLQYPYPPVWFYSKSIPIHVNHQAWIDPDNARSVLLLLLSFSQIQDNFVSLTRKTHLERIESLL